MSIDTVSALVRDVPDFPKPGIVFKDITPVLQDAAGFRALMDLFIERYRGAGVERVIGVESRGFLFGAPLAYELGLGFGIVRKPGKLPWHTIARSYSLEYGEATLEAHTDTAGEGMKVLIVDDLLATGGTALATVELLRELGADVVGAAFAIELGFLPGREKLEAAGVEVFAPLVY